MDAAALRTSFNPLAPHYSRFRVTERILLTGHSHQAWPDCAFDAQQQAWLDAAHYVDEKWEAAFAQADRVRRGYGRLLNDGDGDREGDRSGMGIGRGVGHNIALAENTHELLVRLFSALDWSGGRTLLMTDGEFHSARRQADRMAEAGVPVIRVAASPVDSVAERMAAQVDEKTACVIISSVFFLTGRIVPELNVLADACRQHGVPLVIDAYHHMNVIPFDIRAQGIENAYVVGAGYKYCQLGEGNAFMRLPHDCDLRPIITGWYSEFGALTSHRQPGVQYGVGGHRFSGATYDPTSNYRAARVFDFFIEHGLTPALLRDVSQHQIGLLMQSFDRLDLDPAIIDRDRTVKLEQIGGFLALRSPHAGALNYALKARNVFTDFRGDVLRFGPAPYLSDVQLQDAMAALGEAARALDTGVSSGL